MQPDVPKTFGVSRIFWQSNTSNGILHCRYIFEPDSPRVVIPVEANVSIDCQNAKYEIAECDTDAACQHMIVKANATLSLVNCQIIVPTVVSTLGFYATQNIIMPESSDILPLDSGAGLVIANCSTLTLCQVRFIIGVCTLLL